MAGRQGDRNVGAQTKRNWTFAMDISSRPGWPHLYCGGSACPLLAKSGADAEAALVPVASSVSVELAELARELAEGPRYMASFMDSSCT